MKKQKKKLKDRLKINLLRNGAALPVKDLKKASGEQDVARRKNIRLVQNNTYQKFSPIRGFLFPSRTA